MDRAKRLRLSAFALLLLVAAAAFYRGIVPRLTPAQTADPLYEQYRNRTEVALNGYFRDFSPAMASGGHPDFDRSAAAGGGRYAEIVADHLGDDGVPVFRSGGRKVSRPWRDAQGRAIIPTRPYISAQPGDQPGAMDSAIGGAVADAESFSHWFRDVPGVNTGSRGQLVVRRPSYPGVFVFDGYLDAPTPQDGNDRADVNPATTYAAETLFIYERGAGQYIGVETDASAWVFVGGRLVIDAGGAASRPWDFSGIRVNGPIVLEQSSRINVDPASNTHVVTNATAPGSVRLVNSAKMDANLKLGPGADPSTVVQGASRITGTITNLADPQPLPTADFPVFSGPSRGALTYTGRTETFAESFRCDALTIDTTSVITVAGNITIICDGDVVLRNSAVVNLAPGASLDVYTRGRIVMENTVQVNANTGDPSLVTFFSTSDRPIEMPNSVTVYAFFIAPRATMHFGQTVNIFGGFFGEGLIGRNTGSFTIFDAAAGSRHGTQVRASQRIDLDRLGWLQHQRTYTLHIFFADRNHPGSPLRLVTNIDTLNLAVPPPMLNERD